MKSSLPNLVAAPDWARPSARAARPNSLTLTLRGLVAALALIAAILASVLPARRADAAATPTLYSFAGGTTDGAFPEAPPVEDSSGNLWGTTLGGGTSNEGTVWEITKASVTSAVPTKETIISFTGTANGEYPIGGLCVGSDGSLYGTTYEGGTNSFGTFFKVVPATKVLTVLFSMTSTTTGVSQGLENPSATPVQDSNNGYFYFPCIFGGKDSVGGVVAFNSSGTAEYAYSFGNGGFSNDGYYPVGQVCVDTISSTNYIFGTATSTVTGLEGAVFRLPENLTPATAPICYTFTGGGGDEYSASGLIKDSSGNLYGVTANGGTSSRGKVFELPGLASGTLTQTVLYNFPSGGPTAAIPAYPLGTPAFNSAGTTLFDTTSAGGGSAYSSTTVSGGKNYTGGNFFSLLVSSATYSSLYAFTSTSPDSKNFYSTTVTSAGYFDPTTYLNYLTSGPYLAPDGYFYATGYEGGSAGDGTVYRFGPPWTYNYTYFTPGNPTALTLNLVINDYLATVSDTYALASPIAPSHGTISTPLTGSITAAPTTLPNTYTPTASFTGLDSFTYTGTNSLGTSLTGSKAYGNVSVYVGTLTASAAPTTVTGTTTTLTTGGTLPASSDTTLIYTWSTTGTGVTYSAANGTHAAGATAVTATFTHAGTYTFVLTATAPDGTILTATPATLTVTVTAAAATLSVSPATATVGVSSPVTLTASATDQFGNTLTPSVTWSAPAGSFSSTTTNPTTYTSSAVNPSTTTVTATSNGLTATAAITVNSPVLTTNPTATVSGATISLMANDSVVPAAGTTTYAWSVSPTTGISPTTSTAENPSFTITGPGTWTFQLIATNAAATPSSVTKTVMVTVSAAPYSIVISPTTLTAYPGGPSNTFTAVVKDQFGNTLSGQTVTWGVGGAAKGSITTGGVYSVPASVTATATDTVTATLGSITSNTATVTISQGTVTCSASASPTTVNGTTTTLTSVGTWTGGASSYLTYTITLQSGPASVALSNPNGTNSAANETLTFTASGTYKVYVVATSPNGKATGQSATITITVTLPPTISEPAGVIGINQEFDPNVTTDSYGYVEGTDTDNDGDTEAFLQAQTSYTGSTTYNWTYTGPSGVTYDTADGYGPTTYDPFAYFTQAGTYVFTCTINAGGTILTTSVTYILHAVGTTITIAPAGPLYIGKGTTQQFTATGETDQFGHAISIGSLSWYCFNGTISATGLYTATTAGSGFNADDVYAEDNANPDGSESNFVTVNVYNPAPTVATEIAGTTSTGTDTATTTTTSSNLSVLGQWISGSYNLGESNLTYTWSTFGTQPGTVNFSVNGTNAAKNTVATFSAAGKYYIYVTIKAPNSKSVQDPTSGTYLVVTVNQTLTTVTVSPASATLNLGTQQNFNATGYDQFGTAMSTPPTFTWTTSFGAPSSVNSTGQFSANTPGTGTVTATTGSLSGHANVTVNDAAPTLGAITLDPTVAGPPYTITGTSTGLVVTGQYAGPGSLTYTWSKVSGPGTVSFSGGTSNTPGLAVETTALFGASGTYTIQVVATDSQGLSSSPATVTITVAPTFSKVVCTPNPITVPIGTTQQFTAVAYDQFGIALTSQPTFTWTVTNSGGAASTIGTAGLLTAGTSLGTAVVKATATVGSVTAFDTSAVTIGDVAPTLSAITSNHNPLTGTACTFTVTGTYAGGGTLTYAWSATGPSNVVFSGGTSGTSGSAVTTTATFNAIGTYTIQVIVSDAAGQTATQTYTETVSPTESKILTNLPLSLGFNSTVTATATAYDQFGVALATQPSFAWSVTAGGTSGSINAGSGVFTSTNVPGTATISVTGSTVMATGTITVINQPPTVATAASANPNPVTTGKTTNLTVLGAYTGSGGEGALTYTWSAVAGPASPSFSVNGSNAAKNTVCTFAKAGTYDLRVTITDAAGGTTSSDVTVTVNQTLTTITVTPGPTDTETIGTGTQTYTATGYGQFGNPMAVPPTFMWSNTGVGSVNSSTGVYTITVPGTATITASAPNGFGTTITGSTAVTVNDVAPTVGTAASATPNPVGGTTTALSVLGQYTNGESNLTYTWASSPSTGVSFSANGTNASKNTTATFSAAGSYTFTVTIADGYGGTVTSSVVVTVVSTATTITVTPNPASVAISGTQQFTATATDQFGTAISSPTFTWSVKNGYGTITAGGLYTAGTVPNQETVEAAIAGATGDATVNVTDVNPTLGSITITPNPVTGTTATFSVTGTYTGGGTLTYAWSTSGTPPAPVTFSGGTSGASGSAVTATGTFTQSGSYTVRVTVSDQYGAFATETLVFTVNQTPTTLTVGPTPASVTDGTTQQFTATVSDQFGNPLATQPTFTWTVSSGSGTVNSSGLYTAPTLPGSSTVKATGDGLSGSAAVTNVDAPPTVATAASASPNPVTTGTTTNLSVLGAYVDGESDLTYTWSVTSGSGVTFSVNGTNAAKNTVATFTQGGTYTFLVTITDPSGTTATSSVSVTVDVANGAVVISPSPGAVTVGGTLQLSATQNDQFGNPLLPQPTFTWTLVSGGGSVSASGLFTAPGAAGTSTVKATSSNGQTATVTITTGDVAPTITTAASASPNPVTGKTTSLTVTAGYPGNLSTLTYTWSYTGPSGVTYTGSNGTNGASSLQANFTQAGTYVFTVTVANTTGQSVTSSVTVTVSQTLTNIVVTPSTASIAIGTTQQFTATAYDQFGNALTTQPTYTWTVPVGTGTVNSNGLYSAPSAPGSATVKATTGSFSDTGAITITDTPVTVATAASASPSTVTGTSTTLSVLGAWNGGESNLTYTWSVSGPASVTYFANGTNGAKNTVATFGKAGTYVFTVTITDGYGGSATSSVTVTVNTTATTLFLTPTSATINVGGTKQFTATVYDQFGVALSPQPTYTWTIASGPGSVSSSGLYTATATAGTATVNVTAGSLSGSATVTVNDVAPTVATAASATPNPVTAKTTTLSVLGAYAGGESNLTYTWSLTSGPTAVTYSANGTNAAKSTTATFTQAGSYQFLVTIATPSGLTVTSSVTVTVNQTSTSFTVSPVTSTVAVNGSEQLTASVLDQFGNALVPQPTITWTLTAGTGTVGTNGLYNAPASAGTATVKATTGSFSGTLTINITDGSPTVATAASATPNPVPGKTTALSVLGAYVGGESTLTYTWSATGPAAVTYSINGTNAAKNTTATFTKAGTYTFTVTITTPSGYSVTSMVTVTVNQTPTSVTVTPNPGSIGVGGTLQMTATSVDQFGTAISPSPTFTWSVASGGGTISSSGLYTAPNTVGTATVKATAGSASGTATINIVAAGTLNGTVSTSSAAVNLTTQGTLDWDHWGRGVPGLDQKSGGNLITGYTAVGTGTLGAYRTDSRPLSWTNGTPTASSTNNITGVYSAGQGSGFQIKSPAIGTTRTLVVYVGGNGAGGTLTATMSDGSTGTYTSSLPSQAGVWDAEYTFVYSSGTAGATLNVTWVQSTSGNGSVTLSAATLH